MTPTMQIYIEYDGKGHLITNMTENDTMLDMNMLYDKYWFIIKNKQNENIKQLADIWLMKKYYGVTYPLHVERLLHEILSE